MQLAEYRNRQRLTLQTFGERCGVTASTVRKWELGNVFPRPAQIDAIERATNGEVTAADLLARYRHANAA